MNARDSFGIVRRIALLSLVWWFASSGKVRAQMPDTWTEWSSWSLEETNFISDFGYEPIGFTNALSVPSFDGLGVLIASNGPAFLAYNMVEADGSTNLSLPSGSFLTWFAPTNWSGTNAGGGSGPGSWGRFLEIGQSSGSNTEFFSLYTDPGGGNLYLSAQTNGGSPVLFLSAPICWTNGVYHQIGVTYCPTGTVLYLNGVYATNGVGVTVWPGLEEQTNGFFLGSDGGSSQLQQAYGVFDNLETFSAPIDPGTVAMYYGFDSFPLFNPPGPLPYIPLVPSTPQIVPVFDAVTGNGNLTAFTTNLPAWSPNANAWITNVSALWQTQTNETTTNTTLTINFEVMGGTNSGVPWDVFINSVLDLSSATNHPWFWQGQAYPAVSYALTNLAVPSNSISSYFLILGNSTIDSDADGVTDAYELLVSKTDPHNPSTSGDSILDGWKVVWGLNPLGNNWSQPSQRSNYGYTATDWLNGVSGVRAGSFSPDFEGNIESASQ